MKLKPEMYMKTFSRMKKCLILAITHLESNYYNELNKLIVDKMKDKKVGVAIEEFIG